MSETESCGHLELDMAVIVPRSDGCDECRLVGSSWVHLRVCATCGFVGCCDSSPHRHATRHWQANPAHPIIRSYEPGEDWWWCYVDQLWFDVEGAPPAPSHP